jgi:hypothetical protein
MVARVLFNPCAKCSRGTPDLCPESPVVVRVLEVEPLDA